MANNKMLIDAAHEEETRVVVVKGNKIEEFDFEAANRRQLKGNIYLAKVTRVEPSLQAAFVDFGGNRHGFLAFSEIHPDYYQIPAADRAELLREEREAAAEAKREEALREAQENQEEEEKAPRRGRNNRRRTRRGGRYDRRPARGIFTSLPAIAPKESNDNENEGENNTEEKQPRQSRRNNYRGRGYRGRNRSRGYRYAKRPLRGVFTSLPPYVAAVNEDEAGLNENKATKVVSEATGLKGAKKSKAMSNTSGVVSLVDDNDTDQNEDQVDTLDSSDDNGVEEETPRPAKRKKAAKKYEIQQVIKRRQIILVQVVKEERGNKGAALTTYLSLAGRYCVLMPNTPKGGGISRKITNMSDRKRLKEVAEGLVLDEGMGLIVRTAGANRTKMDIKRDYEYLIRLWENVRNLTLRSVAPHLVYEEGNLIKRSIRDLYDREIENVLVSGDKAYRDAKAFMQMLMPSHAKKVHRYKEPQPIFIRHHVEQQLDQIYSPNVTLKSGGYLVINQTEALVSIDINSGKSTKENSIENTALSTNLEAAEEIARQLRLRDLAGLVVIDFIDMEENRNNKAVEKKLKDCLAADRARIQVGRISHFGLLEMSRQRLRASLLEGSTDMCPHCQGTGLIRSTSSMALHILNSLEHQLLQGKARSLNIYAPMNIAMFLLNDKRHQLFEIENRYEARINIEMDPNLDGVAYRIETSDAPVLKKRGSAVRLEHDYGSDAKIEKAKAEERKEQGDAEAKKDKPANNKKRRGRPNKQEKKPVENGEAKLQPVEESLKTDAAPETEKVEAKDSKAKPAKKTAAKKPAAAKKAESKAKVEKTEEKPEAADAPKAEAAKPVEDKAPAKAEAPAKEVEKVAQVATVAEKVEEKPKAPVKQGWWSRRFSRN